jgi:hypothetical protein
MARPASEGNRVGEQERRLKYPASHRLRRGDGGTFDLWSLRLGDFGLEYEAFHVANDRYWSDSGGSWRRTGDPMEADLSKGRHQVLMHPIHWRAPRRAIFVLFAARSGSTWLTNFMASATPCQAVHEWSLNHRFDPTTETFVQEKRTGTDFVGLMERPDEAMKLLRETQILFQRGTMDLFEANTYLEPFVVQLKDLFPGCVIVQLHRDGRDVVRSILERGWYGAPDERKHAKLTQESGELDQFSRACLYWTQTNENIASHTDRRLCYERMVSDRAYLEGFLETLGIVVHPLLADEAFPKRLNASRSQDIPGQSEWPQSAKDTYARICGPMHRQLGYALEGSDDDQSPRSTAKFPESASVARSVVDLSFAVPMPGLNRWIGRPWNHSNFLCESAAEGLRLNMKKADRISWLALHRGSWKRCRKAQIAVEPGRYYRFRLEATCKSGQTRLFALSYNARGKLIEQSMLGVVLPDKREIVGAFVTPRGCANLTLAVQCMKNAQNVLLRSLKVEEVMLPERYLARDLLIPTSA